MPMGAEESIYINPSEPHTGKANVSILTFHIIISIVQLSSDFAQLSQKITFLYIAYHIKFYLEWLCHLDVAQLQFVRRVPLLWDRITKTSLLEINEVDDSFILWNFTLHILYIPTRNY